MERASNRGDAVMGYKIPDLKEDIKEALEDYCLNNGVGIRVEGDLCSIVDKHFKKIERRYFIEPRNWRIK